MRTSYSLDELGANESVLTHSPMSQNAKLPSVMSSHYCFIATMRPDNLGGFLSKVTQLGFIPSNCVFNKQLTE